MPFPPQYWSSSCHPLPCRWSLIKHTWSTSLQLPGPAIQMPASSSSSQPSLCISAMLAALLCFEHAILSATGIVKLPDPLFFWNAPSFKHSFLNKCYLSFESSQVTFPQESDCWPLKKLSLCIYSICVSSQHWDDALIYLTCINFMGWQSSPWPEASDKQCLFGFINFSNLELQQLAFGVHIFVHL